jgi:hypothetical protein
MANPFTGILSTVPETIPQVADQPAPKDHDKNNTTSTAEPTMAGDRAATAPPQEPQPSKKRKLELRAKSVECKTQLEQPKLVASTSQAPSINNNTNNSIAGDATPNIIPIDPRDAAATILTLQQQLYILEQHTLHYRREAGRHIQELENIIRGTWERTAQLETNVTFLIGEVEKANVYNGNLNEHVLALRRDAETREAKHRIALQSASKAPASRSSSRTASALPPPPPPPRPLPNALQDSNTLLEHNRATIRTLRSEVRDLKASKKELQDRLLELGSAPAVDGRAFFQNAGVSREVLNEWSQVLLGRDREIAGLLVRV